MQLRVLVNAYFSILRVRRFRLAPPCPCTSSLPGTQEPCCRFLVAGLSVRICLIKPRLKGEESHVSREGLSLWQPGRVLGGLSVGDYSFICSVGEMSFFCCNSFFSVVVDWLFRHREWRDGVKSLGFASSINVAWILMLLFIVLIIKLALTSSRTHFPVFSNVPAYL